MDYLTYLDTFGFNKRSQGALQSHGIKWSHQTQLFSKASQQRLNAFLAHPLVRRAMNPAESSLAARR